MYRMVKAVAALAILFASAISSNAQTKARPKARPASAASTMTPLERRASLNLDAARKNPLQLRNLLFKMPKGADLHNHLAGAIYAESWIRAAAEDHLCIDPVVIQGTKSVFSASDNQRDTSAGSCGDGKIPAADIYKDQNLYDELIDAFSIRGFVPSPGVTAHDQFFRTF